MGKVREGEGHREEEAEQAIVRRGGGGLEASARLRQGERRDGGADHRGQGERAADGGGSIPGFGAGEADQGQGERGATGEEHAGCAEAWRGTPARGEARLHDPARGARHFEHQGRRRQGAQDVAQGGAQGGGVAREHRHRVGGQIRQTHRGRGGRAAAPGGETALLPPRHRRRRPKDAPRLRQPPREARRGERQCGRRQGRAHVPDGARDEPSQAKARAGPRGGPEQDAQAGAPKRQGKAMMMCTWVVYCHKKKPHPSHR
mmetsp:Transcript_5240/g.18307  ORF Transcript_5240/g.18307 Transcript_5240/m.18307 type:complete len:260 (+) Transcript_5240:333-1112(+)